MNDMVIITDLNLSVATKQIITNISYRFQSGTIYGILGSNGSGKTTLLNCIAGLNTQHTGIIQIDSEYKKSISFLQANLIFYEKMSANEFIKLCLTAKGVDYKNIEEIAKVFELPLHDYVEVYSTGMKKKLMLLVFLLLKDKIILLDEPFANLDIQTNNFLIEAIIRLGQLGSTIIIASHDIDLLYKCSNKLLLIYDGTIVCTEESHESKIIKKKFEDIISEQKSKFLNAVNLANINNELT